MFTRIRIKDSKDKMPNFILDRVLETISNGDEFYWAILFLDGRPKENKKDEFVSFMDKIESTESGMKIEWNKLLSMPNIFFQMYETIILGCKNKNALKYYKNKKKMYESCDVVIELVDCAFWEISSKNKNLIDQISKKFNESEFLNLDTEC